MYMPSDASDAARIYSTVSGGLTSLNMLVSDDSNDSINIQTQGWSTGNQGPINLLGGNITAQVENANYRGFNVQNSAGTSILYARNDGLVGIGTTNPVTQLDVHTSISGVSAIQGIASDQGATEG